MTTIPVFDCVVIGGGIIGANIMRSLMSMAPKWQVALLERSLIGGETSRYSAGLHFPYGRTPKTRHLAGISETEYATINAQLDLPITPVSFIGIVSADRLNQEYTHFIRPPIHKITTKDIIPQSIGRIILEPNKVLFQIDGCHYANVNLLASRLIENIRHNYPVKIWEGVDVARISDEGKMVHIGLRDGRTIYARHVILAPGPWIVDEPFQPHIASLGIRIKKVVALHIDKTPQPDDPVLFFLDHDAFLLPMHERGHWLFSYTCQEWDIHPRNSSLTITSKDRIEALEILEKYCPDLVKDCTSGRVFCDAYTPNRVPIITVLPNMPRVVFAGAANGSGYRLAPAIAQEAAQLVSQNFK